MSHLADSRWFQGDPYRIDPAELDPVDLALSPYLRGTYYDVASQSMMPISSLYPSPTPPPSLQAARRRRQRQRQRSRPMSKRARIPASSKAILGLKEVLPTTTAATTMDDDDDCAICLKALADPADQDKEDQPAAASADVEMMTRLRAMPCSHIFHQHCIFQWLHRNAVCPLCRHQLPTTDDDDDDDGEDEEGYYGTDFWFPAPVTDDEGSWEEEEEPRRRQ